MPTEDVDARNMWMDLVDGGTSALFARVDDGVAFTDAVDNPDTIRNRWADNDVSCVLGFTGASTGPVTTVRVNYRVYADGPVTGTVQVTLLDGVSVLGSAQYPLAHSPANLTDTYTGLNVSDANNLRTEIAFHRTAPTDSYYIRMSMIWLEITVGGP